MVSLLMGRKRRYLFTSHLSSSSGQGPYSELTPTAYLDLAFFAHFYLVLVAVYLEFYQRPPPPLSFFTIISIAKLISLHPYFAF